MKNFLQVFTRLGGFLLFLTLEVVCFVLIVQYNQRQKDIYINTLEVASRNIDEGIDAATGYFSLRKDVNALHAENARIQGELELLKAQLQQKDLPEAAAQTVENPDLTFEYVPAKIISKNFLGLHNNIVLDRGIRDSIDVHMGVIGDRGIIGVTTSVSQHHARVMPILHRQSRISASIKRNGYFGSLVWRSSDPTLMELEAIPKHADVYKGDTIQTSGYSSIFPEGIAIGVVDSLKMGHDNYHIIKVKLINDMSNLKFAYVLKNGRRRDLSKLEYD